MNIYVVVEGEVGEKQVYRVWIPCVNNQLTFSPEIDMVKNNNFHIVHGGGFPNYFTVIENAIKDISLNLDTNENRLFGRLVVGVDSEENSYDQRRSDIDSFIKKELKKYDVKDLDYRIIVQDFCLEAWGLGNRKIINTSVNKGELGKFTKHYNVRKNDPELLTPPEGERLTRAQFAEKYLKTALLHKHRNLTYTKSNPEALLSDKYFYQLSKRLSDTGHIKSFQDFLDAFK